MPSVLFPRGYRPSDQSPWGGRGWPWALCPALSLSALVPWWLSGSLVLPVELPVEATARHTVDTPRNVQACPARPPDIALLYLADSARDLGLTWVALEVNTSDAITQSASQHLDVWQAQVSMQGGYSALKRWLRESITRYPNLTVAEARLTRRTANVGASFSAGWHIEAQFQLVWLLLPAQSAMPVSPVSSCDVVAQ